MRFDCGDKRAHFLRAIDRFELGSDVVDGIRAEIEAEAAAEERTDCEDAQQSQAAPAKKSEAAKVNTWPKKPRGPGYVRIVDPSEVDAFADGLPRRHARREDRDRAFAVVKRIRESGAWKQTLQLPASWRDDLDRLQVVFPNFARVIDYLRASFALAARSGRGLKWPPLCLDGPPGIGKSYFAEALAQIVGVPSRRVDMAAQGMGMGLIGCDKHYDDPDHGLVFELLAYGRSASPVIILDELDKASGDDRFPATAGLFSLLEPRAAAAFRDQAFPELRLNAAYVLWIATANDARMIPAPIRDRMRVIEVDRPVPDQMRDLVRAMHADALGELLPGLSPRDLDDEVVGLLAAMAPRRIAIALREALGRAAYAGRDALTVEDLVGLEGDQRSIRFV